MPATGKQNRKSAGSTTSRPTSGKKKAAKNKLKKKITVKKTAKEKTPKKTRKKRSAVIAAKRPSSKSIKKELPLVEPGPPTVEAPPVEEPASQEQAIGVVTHYYSDLGVAVIQINRAKLKTGDRVRIKGHTTDFTQTLSSMEYEHGHVDEAVAGQCVGIKVDDHARVHDIVYLE
ncbi:MAG: hypothetical protein OEW15_02975 [Nitrospirota bacterium]|nr:hypothetical protein [Nitrospirota bacterium]